MKNERRFSYVRERERDLGQNKRLYLRGIMPSTPWFPYASSGGTMSLRTSLKF